MNFFWIFSVFFFRTNQYLIILMKYSVEAISILISTRIWFASYWCSAREMAVICCIVVSEKCVNWFYIFIDKNDGEKNRNKRALEIVVNNTQQWGEHTSRFSDDKAPQPRMNCTLEWVKISLVQLKHYYMQNWFSSPITATNEILFSIFDQLRKRFKNFNVTDE